jgi:hypothetical protein
MSEESERHASPFADFARCKYSSLTREWTTSTAKFEQEKEIFLSDWRRRMIFPSYYRYSFPVRMMVAKIRTQP